MVPIQKYSSVKLPEHLFGVVKGGRGTQEDHAEDF